MTAEREEIKYLIPVERVSSLVTELNQHISLHRFEGEGANRLPDAQHFVTTIYFDTPGRKHYRAAVRDGEHNIKVRAKEYYDLHPALAELATDPEQIVRFQPFVWLEVKRREGTRTLKRRFRLSKRDVPEVFGGGRVSPEALIVESEREAALEGLTDLAEYVAELGEPLEASCLVNYRRISWQDAAGALRVTLDLGLAFFDPPADLWHRTKALVRGGLGSPRGIEPHAVLEVKRRAPMPSWLACALENAQVRPAGFSKFVAAAGVVHGKG
jgi:hypothetical protein